MGLPCLYQGIFCFGDFAVTPQMQSLWLLQGTVFFSIAFCDSLSSALSHILVFLSPFIFQLFLLHAASQEYTGTLSTLFFFHSIPLFQLPLGAQFCCLLPYHILIMTVNHDSRQSHVEGPYAFCIIKILGPLAFLEYLQEFFYQLLIFLQATLFLRYQY